MMFTPILRLLSLVTCAWFLAMPARADFGSGWDALAAGDAGAARVAWLDAAYTGDVDLQFNIGLLHESGLLGEIDYEKAIRWYRPAAARGLPAAQNRLADLAIQGLGMEPDTDLGLDLLTKAAEAGYAPAQNNLAMVYENGAHVLASADLASLWYHRAALQGLPEAQYGLARLFIAGEGGSDPEQGFRWYQAAAEAGFAQAENNLALMYEQGEGVAKDLTAAVYWYHRAAEKGLAVAQNNLAIMLQYGRGTEISPLSAATWYQAAALGGDPFGQINLANAYANGIGVDQDLTEAYAWILIARISGEEAAGDVAVEYARRLSPRLDTDARHEAIARAQILRDTVDAEVAQREEYDLWPMAIEEMGSLPVAAQRYLKELGYLNGLIDGIAGPATSDAIARFQNDRGMEADGRISETLIAALTEAYATMDTTKGENGA
jgi:TPR repeat protein